MPDKTIARVDPEEIAICSERPVESSMREIADMFFINAEWKGRKFCFTCYLSKEIRSDALFDLYYYKQSLAAEVLETLLIAETENDG